MHLKIADFYAMDDAPRVEAEASESKIAVVAALIGNGALTLLKGLSAAATVLALENHSLLIGERAQKKVERVIPEAVTHDDAVSIDRIRTMHVGPREIIAMLAVRFRDDLTAGDIVEAIGRLHSRIETALARDVRPRFVAIEPTGPSRRPSPRVVSAVA
jgi:hypothetical protein